MLGVAGTASIPPEARRPSMVMPTRLPRLDTASCIGIDLRFRLPRPCDDRRLLCWPVDARLKAPLLSFLGRSSRTPVEDRLITTLNSGFQSLLLSPEPVENKLP